jgi:hypothetical protein
MTEIDKDNVVNSLKNGVCKVVFTKANGEDRLMHCTLNEGILPPQQDVEEYIQKKKPNPDVLAVWDTDKGAWRSFRWDSVKEFNTEFNL